MLHISISAIVQFRFRDVRASDFCFKHCSVSFQRCACFTFLFHTLFSFVLEMCVLHISISYIVQFRFRDVRASHFYFKHCSLSFQRCACFTFLFQTLFSFVLEMCVLHIFISNIVQFRLYCTSVSMYKKRMKKDTFLIPRAVLFQVIDIPDNMPIFPVFRERAR